MAAEGKNGGEQSKRTQPDGAAEVRPSDIHETPGEVSSDDARADADEQGDPRHHESTESQPAPNYARAHIKGVRPARARHITMETAKVKIAEKARNPQRVAVTAKIHPGRREDPPPSGQDPPANALSWSTAGSHLPQHAAIPPPASGNEPAPQLAAPAGAVLTEPTGATPSQATSQSEAISSHPPSQPGQAGSEPPVVGEAYASGPPSQPAPSSGEACASGPGEPPSEPASAPEPAPSNDSAWDPEQDSSPWSSRPPQVVAGMLEGQLPSALAPDNGSSDAPVARPSQLPSETKRNPWVVAGLIMFGGCVAAILYLAMATSNDEDPGPITIEGPNGAHRGAASEGKPRESKPLVPEKSATATTETAVPAAKPTGVAAGTATPSPTAQPTTDPATTATASAKPVQTANPTALPATPPPAKTATKSKPDAVIMID